MKKLISIILCFLLMVPSVWAAPSTPSVTASSFSNFTWPTGYAFYTCTNNYYVSKSGSDSNNGAIGTPWLTVGHGESTLQTANLGTTATSTGSTITDTGKSFTTNALAGQYVYVTSGTGQTNGAYPIVSNTATVITVTGTVGTNTTGDLHYNISIAGYCLNVEPGTYSEAVGTGYVIGGSGVGTNGWLVIRSVNSDGTTLNPGGAIMQIPTSDVGSYDYYDNFRFNGHGGTAGAYVWLDGFDMEGQVSYCINNTLYCNDAAVTDDNGVTPTHITVTNSIMANHGEGGLVINHGDYVIAIGCSVYNNAYTSIYEGSGISLYQLTNYASDSNSGSHSIIGWNVVYHNMEVQDDQSSHSDGNGIIIDDARNTQGGSTYGNYTQKTLVINNASYDNGGGGVHIFSSDYVTVQNNTVWDNYNDANDPAFYRGDINVAEGSVNTLINNLSFCVVGGSTPLSYNTAYLDASGSAENTGNVWYNNLAYNGTPSSNAVYFANTTASFTGNGNLNGYNPQFISTVTPNFNVTTGSPAISAGTSSYGYPPTDLQGYAVSPGSITLGAYQFLPQNLSTWIGTFKGVLN